jgi:hypothetical protein
VLRPLIAIPVAAVLLLGLTALAYLVVYPLW